jgi:hypothetical protein
MYKNILKAIAVLLLILIAAFLILVNKNASEYNIKPLNLTSYTWFGDSLGLPAEILVMDTVLLIRDIKPLLNENWIQTYSLKGRFISSFGKKGKGPNEMIGAWKIDTDISYNNHFWVYDLVLKRITEFSIDSLLPNKFITLKEGAPYNPVIVSNNLFISPGLGLFNGRLAFYDSVGLILREVGVIPPGLEEKTPIPIHQDAYQSRLKKTPDGSYVVLAVRFADQLEIYKSSGDMMKRIYGPKKSNPVYNVKSDGVNPIMVLNSKKAIMGYIDVSLSQNKIYALYSGRNLNEYKENASYGNTIHVFNLNGNLLNVYKTEEDLIGIAVDVNDTKMFAIQHKPKVLILTYNLK